MPVNGVGRTGTIAQSAERTAATESASPAEVAREAPHGADGFEAGVGQAPAAAAAFLDRDDWKPGAVVGKVHIFEGFGLHYGEEPFPAPIGSTLDVVMVGKPKKLKSAGWFSNGSGNAPNDALDTARGAYWTRKAVWTGLFLDKDGGQYLVPLGVRLPDGKVFETASYSQLKNSFSSTVGSLAGIALDGATFQPLTANCPKPDFSAYGDPES